MYRYDVRCTIGIVYRERSLLSMGKPAAGSLLDTATNCINVYMLKAQHSAQLLSSQSLKTTTLQGR
jgi:hypothetical protein